MNLTNERKGEILVIFEIFFWALSPIVIKSSNGFLPPLFFAGISMLTASIVTFVILLMRKGLYEIFNIKALPYMIAGTFFIMIICFPILFIAGQKTTVGNYAILSMSEILFTTMMFGFLRIEKISKYRIIGSLFMIFGAGLILLKSFTGQLAYWDLMIIFVMILPPFGNYFQKIAVRMVKPITHLFVRNIIGGIVIISVSLSIEDINYGNIITTKGLLLIFTSGVLSFAISKILILEAFKRIDVSKVIAMGGFMPAMALVLGYIILHEIPDKEQIIGFLFALIGVYFLTKKNENNIRSTSRK